jgi:DNA repair protein SbcC/Rad50
LKSLDDEENFLLEKRDTGKVLRGNIQYLEAEKVRLIDEIHQIEDKIKMLDQKRGLRCPLCETELGFESQNMILSKYHSEKALKQEQFQTNQIQTNQKDSEIKSLEKEILLMEIKIKQTREKSLNKYGNLNKALLDAQDAQQKIIDEKAILNQIEQKMVKKDFALNEQEALNQIERNIKEIGYDSLQHESVRNKLTLSEQYEIPKHQLDEAVKLIGQEQESETRARLTLQEWLLKTDTYKNRRISLLSELTVSSRVAGDLMLAETEYKEIVTKQNNIQEKVGGAKARLERLSELEVKFQEKVKQLNEANKQIMNYRDLAQAFGKKGIQSMLIEMAIPDIEAEANKLLSRMTDNRMHIKLETQRETKKGDMQETLDINISDELGTRNYEMFSGGEAFRIDFAIRIALSKLLARRAGAPLPTLIIDEGFGTQDSSGIEKIKEAITSIQDDFEKILVITHITDFKDAFPMRIEIVKTAEGSAVYLN